MRNPDLLAKFTALREFVEGIPPEKLDMRVVEPRGEQPKDCKCVLGHADDGTDENEFQHSIDENAFTALGVEFRDIHDLFDGAAVMGRRSLYDPPTGLPAKTEFLRRLDVLKEKYCKIPTDE